MKCPHCNGSGYVANQRYYNVGSAEAYERGIMPSKVCSKCNGSGFIIGNIQDIANRLLVAANGITITKREAQQMYDAIMK